MAPLRGPVSDLFPNPNPNPNPNPPVVVPFRGPVPKALSGGYTSGAQLPRDAVMYYVGLVYACMLL